MTRIAALLPLLLLPACVTTSPAQQGAAYRAAQERQITRDVDWCVGYGARTVREVAACRSALMQRRRAIANTDYVVEQQDMSTRRALLLLMASEPR